MKRKTEFLLTIICLLAVALTACKSGGESNPSGPESSETASAQPAEVPTINILLDLCRSRPSSESITNILYSIPGYGTEFKALTETSPFDFQERDAFLTRVKTEIMAGKGPDVFLCENPLTEEMGQGLFPFPQKAMKNHLLLPLDSYIENAEYMEFDKLLPVIMEAGRNDEGQQILPMSFNFWVMAYNKEKFALTEELPVTWDEAVGSSDPMVRYVTGAGDYRDMFGELYDLDKDVMTVPEEGIAACMQQAWDINQDERNGAFPEFTELNEELGFHVMNRDDGTITSIELASHWLSTEYDLGGETEYWLVPKYNTAGGITVNVEAFAAINRNTSCPEESFKVLDKLMSYSEQKSVFYEQLMGMPVHTGVGLDGQSGPGWSMNEWNAGQYKSLLDQINSVRYTTPVEQEFYEIYPDYYNNGGEWADIVHKHYMKMQMMLAES